MSAIRVLLIWLITGALTASANGVSYEDNNDLRRLLAGFVVHDKMPEQWIEQVFEGVTRQNKVLELFNRQAESMPWFRYRTIFDTTERAELGVQFWDENLASLAKAEATYGVPASVIVAIIGVETKYGTILGSHPTLDALTTLAIDYPRRASFFKDELREFLRIALEEDQDPTSIQGSYAGALGIPQFMPSSYRAYAIDFDGDGKRDLMGSVPDAIGSVAAYLARHGWKQGEPVVVRANPRQQNPEALIQPGLRLDTTLRTVREAGVEFGLVGGDTARAKFFSLQGADQTEYYVGLNNFYVITRYNRSLMYALAVHQLSQRIERLRGSE